MTVPLATRLEEVVRELKSGEQEAALIILERLLAGQEVYGAIDLANDSRDFDEEALEEACDELVYRAFRALITARARGLREDLVGYKVTVVAPASSTQAATSKFVSELCKRGATAAEGR